MTSGRSEPAYDRVMAKVVRDGDCLRFTGDRSTHGGYGRVQVNGKLTMVHRVVWEHHYGRPVSDSMTLDHVQERGCKHRDCVNIEHLEEVTHAENVSRKKFEPLELCINGHEQNERNTYVRRDGKRGGCRPCRSINQRRYLARKGS